MGLFDCVNSILNPNRFKDSTALGLKAVTSTPPEKLLIFMRLKSAITLAQTCAN